MPNALCGRLRRPHSRLRWGRGPTCADNDQAIVRRGNVPERPLIAFKIHRAELAQVPRDAQPISDVAGLFRQPYIRDVCGSQHDTLYDEFGCRL
jgi:hypothetical protein